MFAPINSQYQVQHNHTSSQPKPLRWKKLQTPLSFAVGIILSCMAVQVNAATNSQVVYKELPVTDAAVDAEMEDTSQMVYERLRASNVPVKDKEYVAKQTELFFECREVQTSAARLACYDKVVEQGETPAFTMNKKPLDLAETLRTTISGKPKVVLADENSAVNGSNAENAQSIESAQSFENELTDENANERLDTLWLTEREAQVLEDAGVSQTDIERYTALSLAYDLDQNSERGTWTLRPHNPNYVLPLFYSFDPNLTPSSSRVGEAGKEYTSNDIRNTELKFQISLKAKVAEDLFDTRSDLWFGYTQQSHWQVYNEDNSRPFRATDYQPEIFLTQPVAANLPFGGRLRMLGVGAVHHSNGQSDPISRSWNRAYIMGGAEWGKLTVIPRIWTRINNESKDTDDNPDITDYMGHGDLTLLYDLPNQQSISSTLRYNTKTNKGAAQIDYVYPLTKNVNGFVQLFQGYGESIIDYNHENTAIGVGIVLNDWKGF